MPRLPHRTMVEEDDDVAATVMMSDVRIPIDEDALTPRVAPERVEEPVAHLVETEVTELFAPHDAEDVEGSLVGVEPGPQPPPQVAGSDDVHTSPVWLVLCAAIGFWMALAMWLVL